VVIAITPATLHVHPSKATEKNGAVSQPRNLILQVRFLIIFGLNRRFAIGGVHNETVQDVVALGHDKALFVG
jgi:hypothetical protein